MRTCAAAISGRPNSSRRAADRRGQTNQCGADQHHCSFVAHPQRRQTRSLKCEWRGRVRGWLFTSCRRSHDGSRGHRPEDCDRNQLPTHNLTLSLRPIASERRPDGIPPFVQGTCHGLDVSRGGINHPNQRSGPIQRAKAVNCYSTLPKEFSENRRGTTLVYASRGLSRSCGEDGCSRGSGDK